MNNTNEGRYQHWLPWWMRTATGQWLAAHTPIFRTAWQRNMNHALAEEARHDLMDARTDLAVIADRLAFGKASQSDLIKAALHVRNATMVYIRRTTGEDAARAYCDIMEKIDREEFSKGAAQ